MEIMATAPIPVAAEHTRTTIAEPMERNAQGKRSRRNGAQVPAKAPSDVRSRMARTMRREAQALTHLHQTFGRMTNLLEAPAARGEAQRRGLMTWMQEREHICDTRHEDDRLWGAGITDTLTKVMNRAPPAQQASEKERDKSARMDGRGLEASQHADTMQEGGPENHQQLQQQPKRKLQLKLQPK